MRTLPLLLVFAALAGCETAPRPDPSRQPPAAQATAATTAAAAATAAGAAQAAKTYGDPVSPSTPMVALNDLLKSPNTYADKVVRTEGKVTAVCQSKGCWLEIGDDQSMAHVKLGNHKFFVPRSAAGQHAIVQARVMAQVDKGHCEQEAEEQTGKVAKVELEATGVELTRTP